MTKMIKFYLIKKTQNKIKYNLTNIKEIKITSDYLFYQNQLIGLRFNKITHRIKVN